MKSGLRWGGVLAIFAMLMSGCALALPANSAGGEESLLLRTGKPNGEPAGFEVNRTIGNPAIVSEIQDILRQADESRSIVSMPRGPDRRIELFVIGPTASVEPRVYGVWLDANGSDRVALVSESAGGGYILCDPEDSSQIRSVL